MKILYDTAPDGVRLRRCFGLDGEITLPDSIEGKPVVRLGAYLFSDGMERAGILDRSSEADLIWDHERGSLPARTPLPCSRAEGLPAVAGLSLTSLILPSGTRQVGAYAFYGCSSLKSLAFPLSISDWGAGVFTGCTSLEFLRVWPGTGGRSCLKEVLSELHQTLEVEFQDPVSHETSARAVLPEFYEESVENTPARIISRQMHGCGHMYRYCFEDGKFSFREYDRLFSYMKAEENPLLASRMALYRLHWPGDLEEEAKENYQAYLQNHPEETAENLLRPRCEEILRQALEAPSLNRALWDSLAERAEREGRRETMALLMEVFHRRFKQEEQKNRRRRFEL